MALVRDFPLFPLSLVALPSELVPLHIFEERYKTMIGRCLEEGSEFGIVWMAEDGLPAVKIPRLHGIAEAALDGRLDRERLLAADSNEAYEGLQQLPGIGPFYAGLILLRAVGTTDVLANGEPRLVEAVQQRYGEPLDAVAGGWRPFRTWISVLVRSSA